MSTRWGDDRKCGSDDNPVLETSFMLEAGESERALREGPGGLGAKVSEDGERTPPANCKGLSCRLHEIRFSSMLENPNESNE
jgi:hypothetical protein